MVETLWQLEDAERVSIFKVESTVLTLYQAGNCNYTFPAARVAVGVKDNVNSVFVYPTTLGIVVASTLAVVMVPLINGWVGKVVVNVASIIPSNPLSS